MMFGKLTAIIYPDGKTVTYSNDNMNRLTAATGMVYLRARFYEPEMNRFSQKDILRGSMSTPQTLNRYAYCINDSVNFIDPSGMKMMTYQAGGLAEDCSRTLNTIIESSSFEFAIIFSLESNGHGDLW